MNQIETQRLANAVHALRPDWPIASLRTLIATKMLAYTWRDAALAFAFIATDPDTRTPARVLEAGPWWDPARIANTEPTPTPQFDFEAARRSRAHRLPSEDAAHHIAAARAAIRKADA